MSNKVTKEVTAYVWNGGLIDMTARGSFEVSFSKNSKIGRMLDVKKKEKFRVTIERIK